MCSLKIGKPHVYLETKKARGRNAGNRTLYYLRYVHPVGGKRQSVPVGSGRDFALHMKRQFEIAIENFYIGGRLQLPELGRHESQDPLSWETLRDAFVTYKTARIRASSMSAYLYHLNTFRRTMPDIGTPREVDATMAEAYLNQRIEKGIKRSSANTELRNLKIIFKFWVSRGFLRENPFTRIEPFDVAPKAKRIISVDEERALIRAAESQPRASLLQRTRMSAIIRVAVGTGFRRGEIVNMHWSTVDLTTGRIEVRCEDGFRTKNDEGRVSYLTDPESLDVLRKLKVMGAGAEDGRPFFFKDPRNLSNRFRDIGRKAGVDCTLHDLRKTFVTRLTKSGVNSMVITEIVGHSNDEVTRRHYFGLDDELIRTTIQQAQDKARLAAHA